MIFVGYSSEEMNTFIRTHVNLCETYFEVPADLLGPCTNRVGTKIWGGQRIAVGLFPAWWKFSCSWDDSVPLILGSTILFLKTFKINYAWEESEGVPQCKEILKGNELWGQNRAPVSSCWKAVVCNK